MRWAPEMRVVGMAVASAMEMRAVPAGAVVEAAEGAAYAMAR